MTGLFHAHSGLRYLVLLVGLLTFVYAVLGWVSRRAPGRGDRVLMSAFTGLLDLQGLLGIGIMAFGVYYPRLMGHLGLMVLAIAAAHLTAVRARRETEARNAHLLRAVGVLVTLALIVAAIHAIGRSIFGSAPPSVS